MKEKVCKCFHHLTKLDRRKIEKMRNEGASIQEIADALHVNYTTVWRELKRKGVTYTHRNSDWTTEERYSAEKAQAQYEYYQHAKGRPIKLGNDYAFAEYVERKVIEEDKSPYAILADMELEGVEFDTKVCLATLYNWLHHNVFLHIGMKDLPRRGKYKQKYTRVGVTNARVPKGESIEQRPQEINDRSTPFHWEMDTVKGPIHSKKCVLTLTERMSRNEITLPLAACTRAEVVRAINELEDKWGDNFPIVFQSITVDNGSEFQDCIGMESSADGTQRTKVYYCHPYRSSERGTNENHNGMLRRKHPKGTNFDHVPDEDIILTADWMNNYPRRKLGGSTPALVFRQMLQRYGITA